MRDHPLAGMKIVVSGKGGSGKSTFLTLMADVLTNKGYKVHVLDGDASNIGLSRMLGFEEEPEPLINYFGGKTFEGLKKGEVTCPVDDPTPLGKDKMDPKRIPSEYFLEKGDLTFFRAGKIKKAYSGCHGPESKVTRDFVLPGEQVTLIDIEAGVEHLGRGIEVNSDAVITVVDPNYTSFKIAKRTEKMIKELKADPEELAEKMVKRIGSDTKVAEEATKNSRTKYAWTVLNKVNSEEMEASMRGELVKRGIEPIGSVSYDPKVSKSFLEGKALRGPRARNDVEEILDKLERIVAE